MVASSTRIDARCATKFTPGNDTDILIKTARMQIFHQSRDALIELGKLRGQPFEVLTMPVPAAKRKGDATHTCFDQSPGHQKLIHPVGPRVFTERWRRTAATITIS